MRTALLLAAAFVIAAAPAGAQPSVSSYRPKTVSHTLHASTWFTSPARVLLRESADKWRRISNGRIQLTVVFDVDEDNVDSSHDLVLTTTSTTEIARRVDAQFAPDVPVAFTLPKRDGSTIVVFIIDRIAPANFESVAAHEFGHVIGFPDLPTTGAIMSGVETPGHLLPRDLTPEDRELCRGFHLCE